MIINTAHGRKEDSLSLPRDMSCIGVPGNKRQDKRLTARDEC